MFGYSHMLETFYPPSSGQPPLDYPSSTTGISEAIIAANSHISTAPYGIHRSTESFVEKTETLGSTGTVHSKLIEASPSAHALTDQIYTRPTITSRLYQGSSLNTSSPCETWIASPASESKWYNDISTASVLTDHYPTHVSSGSYSLNSTTSMQTAVHSTDTTTTVNSFTSTSATSTFSSLPPNITDGISFETIIPTSCKNLASAIATLEPHTFTLQDTSFSNPITAYSHADGSVAPLLGIEAGGNEFLWDLSDPSRIIIITSFVIIVINESGLEITKADCSQTLLILIPNFLSLLQNQGNSSPGRRDVVTISKRANAFFTVLLTLKDDCGTTLTTDLSPEVFAGEIPCGVSFVPELDLYSANCTYSDSDTCQSDLQNVVTAVLTGTVASTIFFIPGALQVLLGLLRILPALSAFLGSNPITVPLTLIGALGLLANAWSAGSDPFLPWSSRSLGEFPDLGVVGAIAPSRGNCHSGSSCALFNATGYTGVFCPDDPTDTRGALCPHAAWLETTIDPPLVAGNPYVFEMWTNVQKQTGPTVTTDGKPAPFTFSTCGIGAYTAGAKIAARRLNMNIADVGKWVLTSVPFVATEEMGLATLVVGMRCILGFGFEAKLDTVVIRPDDEA
ncbi:hypothetical protein P154DRAFT_624834 [Amniculicola lignicola CBS 123094]|uniref:Uncharacterized protein n=1 Tax=Amniculicola lignicola CBS 123094 TaxID=1392246 RepID=A0A6A5VWY6_9PLEO|nr:hypothetical protein P154DRAFT_624834 [Amniculicola lignicola CBS 123094]